MWTELNPLWLGLQVRNNSQGKDTGRNGGEDRNSVGKSILYVGLFFPWAKRIPQNIAEIFSSNKSRIYMQFFKESQVTYTAVCQVPWDKTIPWAKEEVCSVAMRTSWWQLWTSTARGDMTQRVCQLGSKHLPFPIFLDGVTSKGFVWFSKIHETKTKKQFGRQV